MASMAPTVPLETLFRQIRGGTVVFKLVPSGFEQGQAKARRSNVDAVFRSMTDLQRPKHEQNTSTRRSSPKLQAPVEKRKREKNEYGSVYCAVNEEEAPYCGRDTFLSWIMLEVEPLTTLLCGIPADFFRAVQEYKERFRVDLVESTVARSSSSCTDPLPRLPFNFLRTASESTVQEVLRDQKNQQKPSREGLRAESASMSGLLVALDSPDYDWCNTEAVPSHAARVLGRRIVVLHGDGSRAVFGEGNDEDSLVLRRDSNGRFFRMTKVMKGVGKPLM